MTWVKICKEVVYVVLVALVFAGAGHFFRKTMAPEGSVEMNAGAEVDSDAAYTSITFEEARVHFKNGTAIFADARPVSAYQAGHIKGAMHLDLDEFDAWSGDFFSQVPPDRIIITYCDGAQCTLSLNLAEKLTWMGYEQVFYLKNGWGLWKENKLPSEHLDN